MVLSILHDSASEGRIPIDPLQHGHMGEQWIEKMRAIDGSRGSYARIKGRLF